MFSSVADAASTLCGYVSIACWIVVFTPQLYENWKYKSGAALSLPFLFIWLLGDIFSIIGVVLLGLLDTMLYLAVYYTLMDALLICQYYYYRRNKLDEVVFDTDAAPDAGDVKDGYGSRPLLAVAASIIGINGAGSMRRPTNTPRRLDAVLHSSSKRKQHVGRGPSASVHQVAVISGWLSALFYVGSRVPQIIKNHKNQSCEGLSIWMFLASILGNVTYGLASLSILFHSTSPAYLLDNAAWLVGSLGTLVMDAVIFYQFWKFRKAE
ncbi:putative vacuolar membrane transporter for cationic amino acids [Sorochytrium milnesiophthora]